MAILGNCKSSDGWKLDRSRKHNADNEIDTDDDHSISASNKLFALPTDVFGSLD